jgi:hypothetical protein
LEDITSSDQDPVIINVYYPNIIDSPGYIRPRVQIEIGCRSLIEPFEKKAIISLIDENYSQTLFAQNPVLIPSVLPERTLLEKMFLLHEEYQRPDEKARVNRLSRHLYDIYKLSQTDIASRILENNELWKTIVIHRHSYTRFGGVDYNLHQPQFIKLIPDEENLSRWSADYKIMREQMIYGESPNFDELVESLRKWNSMINEIKWRIEIQFPRP